MKMTKSILSALMLLAFTYLQAQSAKAVSNNSAEEAVWAVVEEGFNAFNAYDAKRFAAIFSEDVDFISPIGSILKGRKQVEEAHAQLFKMWGGTPNPNVKTERSGKKLEFLNPNLALVVLRSKGTDAQTGQSEENAFSMLIQKNKGKWEVRTIQLTPVQPMPGMGN